MYLLKYMKCFPWVGLLWVSFLLENIVASEESSTQRSLTCSGDCLDASVEQELKTKCPDVNRNILVGYTPTGNLSAGKYERITDGDNSTESCVRQCCGRATCNYVFMVNETCFVLTCNQGPDPCVPVKLPEGKVVGGIIKMVLVRSPTKESDTCEVGLEETQCKTNEICSRVNARSRNGLCKCREDFIVNPEGQCVNPGSMADGDQDESQTTSMPVVASSTKKTVRQLEVSVEDKNVTLPSNEVALFVHASPSAPRENPYSYEWRLISHPTEDTTEGTKEGQMTDKLRLQGLKQGSYVFQVVVKGVGAYGTTNATVTVFPENRTNLAPLAKISPAEQTVQLPTASVVLDAVGSTDDQKIVSYKWELQKGPIEYTFNPTKTVNSTTLQVENLIPGNYTFKLTVEDAGHLTNSTTANITVIKETDYPPTAIAGKDVVIYLPTTEVTLNGNSSTDDKKIVSWEWKATGESNQAADMQDTHTPYLKLSHLQEGLYQYELKVTDEAGQSSISNVHVFVKKNSGTPPKASAGADQSFSLPQTWTTLDSSNSTADTRIVKWQWVQLKGPTNATIQNPNEAKANVTGLTKGDYEFQVEVEDDAKLSAKSTVKVTVTQKTNKPPTAHAGGERTISLPSTVALFNGSLSTDDVMITNWKWDREPESSAAGVVIGDSDTTPILQLTSLVPGKYVFKLTVKDEQGLASEDVATLNVKEDPLKKDLIEIVIDIRMDSLKEADLEKFLHQMSFLLHDTQLVFDRMQSQLNTENAVLILHGTDDARSVIEGSKLASELRRRLRQDVNLLQFHIISIDTVLCLDSCSGHGTCHDSAVHGRQCVCHAFWMENFLKMKFGNGERNCEWSKVYVGVITCLLLLMLFALLWSLVFLFRKNLSNLKANLSTKPTANGISSSARGNGKRHYSKKQYTLLDDDEIELECKSDPLSEDDEAEFEDSDSDVLFETKQRPNSRKINGNSKKFPLPSSNGHHHHSRNGILKPPRRVKT
ncbi:unnamed protein product [Allacma fusca]|uniref:PKD/Chitinase domain-containing protein n=1 Tax=Allacma fusca TaxID=39272 RepID=A0A8J2JAK6_9HEXA|nr:unnamed protein product [Allacma fusca]